MGDDGRVYRWQVNKQRLEVRRFGLHPIQSILESHLLYSLFVQIQSIPNHPSLSNIDISDTSLSSACLDTHGWKSNPNSRELWIVSSVSSHAVYYPLLDH
jgi:hypothetical protein